MMKRNIVKTNKKIEDEKNDNVKKRRNKIINRIIAIITVIIIAISFLSIGYFCSYINDNTIWTLDEIIVIIAILIYLFFILLITILLKRFFYKNMKKRIKLLLLICDILLICGILIMSSYFYNYYYESTRIETALKPIIYLYPEEETEVEVILGYEELITCSYPEYEESWNVLAYPNGDLIYLDTDRNLYSLYYESTNAIEFEVEVEGFVVAREDIAEFLEEKLAILGLTEREAEEFIIYWLPKLEENEYNYIRFATYEELEENMPLEIGPEPDTIIRILMTYKGLDEPIEVEEQELETVERKGFVAVEWGGTEIE